MEERRLSQTQLAEASGVSQPTISKLLSGETKALTPETAEKLATALGTAVEKLTAVGIPLRKPHLARTLLQSDGRKILKSLVKAIVDGLGFGFTGVCQSVGDIVKELRKLDTPELGWVLLYRSMYLTIMELFAEVAIQYEGLTTDAAADRASSMAEEALEAAEVVIDAGFFRDPSPRFVEAMTTAFRSQLEEAGMTSVQAAGMARRLRPYFLSRLQAEFRGHREDYARLLGDPATPFDAAVDRERQWLEYETWLARKLHEPLFDETFSLNEVFIPLRCWWYERDKGDVGDGRRHPRPSGADLPASVGRSGGARKRKAEALDRVLMQWIDALRFRDHSNPDDAIRVIRGDAGAGKSCSSRRFAVEAQRQAVSEPTGSRMPLRVLYVPLHRYDFLDDLPSALDRFCAQHDPPLPTGLLSPEARDDLLVLAFDGLDELEKSGRAGVEAARDFVDQIRRWLILHGQRRRVAFLLSGRPIAVDHANVHAFRDEQVLYLLPYAVSESDRREIEAPVNLLTEDQRQAWWRAYGNAKELGYGGLPEELASGDGAIQELTTQPLLNYLVALSYRRYETKAPGALDFSEPVTRTALYGDLLCAIWERPWSDRERRADESGYAQLRGFPREEFEQILEEIALAAWHGSGRTATQAEVEAHLSQAQKGLLERTQSGIRSGLLKVFVGFYIQARQIRPGEEAFEFTHKSFGEYLAARRMVRAVVESHEGWLARRNGKSYGYDDKGVLAEWAKVFGPTRLTHEVNKFLRQWLRVTHTDEGHPRFDRERLSSLRGFVVALINHVLREGMPMERLTEIKTFYEQNQQAVHTEEALVALHCAISAALTGFKTGQTPEFRTEGSAPAASAIDWTSRTAAGNWIKRLTGQCEPETALFVIRDSLGWIDFQGQCLTDNDLVHVNLRGANLGGANLRGANLFEADLRGANLGGAELGGAILRGAILRGAILREADLVEVDLADADLLDADLRGADLVEADLGGANLGEANLRDANFGGAGLQGTDLRGADLGGANLGEANLMDADLGGADLFGARVSDTQLKQTIGKPWRLPDGTGPKRD